jgi:motility quorum-sensing regulator / GCU-specific mRNA interferase toxin
MKPRRSPTYDLARIQERVKAGQYRITFSARLGAGALGFTESDIVRAVLSLRPGDFYKSMEAEAAPGLWQDVYRPRFAGVALYVKLQIEVRGDAVVISFKGK